MELLDKYTGAIIGSAVGDALGRATEFMLEADIPRYYDSKVTDYEVDLRGNFELGEFTDDTNQMLCIADSFIEYEEVDINDIAARFYSWLVSDGRGCGPQTYTALNLLREGLKPIDAGKHTWEIYDKDITDNGGIMRNAPISLMFIKDIKRLIYASENICRITHYDRRCVLSSVCLSVAMYAILKGMDIYNTVCDVCENRDDEFDDVIYEAKSSRIADFKLDGEDCSNTYLTTKVALCSVLNYNNFIDPIIEIVNKGGDADTNACVAGGLLGSKYGLDSIPKYLQDGLYGYSRLYNVANDIYYIVHK